MIAIAAMSLGLIDLDDEAILRVASYGLDADDLNNLALTCKHFSIAIGGVGSAVLSALNVIDLGNEDRALPSLSPRHLSHPPPF